LNGFNLGLIVAIVLAVSQIGLTIFLVFMRGRDLEKIIKQDCLFVENKSTQFLNSHFFNRRLSTAPNALNTQEPEDLNTSRNLNIPKRRSIGDNKELKLKENIMDEFENVEPVLDGNKNNGEEVQIYNNFVAQRTNIDMTHNENSFNNTITNNDRDAVVCPIHVITMRDYHCLTLELMLIYDKRNFRQYLVDNLVRDNLILSLIFKHSIIDPVYLRIAKLIFSFSLLFGTNAFLQIPTKGSASLKQIPLPLDKVITSIILTSLCSIVISIIVYIPDNLLVALNTALKSRDGTIVESAR
jgi:hypothetical protein